ncbi:MAG: hypothetical protein AB8H47_13435 [Bacteroidia bacterium]
MKYLCLFVALIGLGANHLLAQTPQVEWGPNFKQGTHITTRVAGVGADEFYTYHLTYHQSSNLKFVEKTVKLQRFNHDMVQTKDGKISLKYQDKNRRLERFLMLDRRLYMFTSYLAPKERKQILLVEQINLSSMQSQEQPRELASIDLPIRDRLGEFDIKVSHDSSKVLVYANKPSIPGQRERFSFLVLNDQMESLWTLDEELPYEDRRFGISDLKVSNQGQIILSALKTEIEPNEENTSRLQASMKEVHFLVYLNQGTKRQQYIVELEERKIAAIEIELSPQGELICGGLYGEGEKVGLAGTFLLRFDTQTETLLTETYSPFEKRILVQMIGKKAVNKDRSPVSYLLDEMILKSDGGVILIAESFQTQVVSINQDGQFSIRTYYYFGDILITNLDKDGNVNWHKNLEKNQVSAEDAMYSSYKLMRTPNELCFIYNDNKRNAKADKKGKHNLATGKNAVVTLASISVEGDITKESLIDSNDEGVFFIPFLSFQYNNHEMLLRAEKRRNSRYARVIFE